MKKNVGSVDRIARIGLGSILVLVGIAGYAGLVTTAFGPVPQALAAVLLALIGLVLLVTGLLQWCLVYRVLGVSTYREAPEAPAEPEPADGPNARGSG